MEKETHNASPLLGCNSQTESNKIKHKHSDNQQLRSHASASPMLNKIFLCLLSFPIQLCFSSSLSKYTKSMSVLKKQKKLEKYENKNKNFVYSPKEKDTTPAH